MPSLDKYKKALSKNGFTIGQMHKTNADMLMENSWSIDIQSRICYIYDVFHDDQTEMYYGYDPSKSATKTKIDAKFIKSSTQTTAKDIVDYRLQFRPSQKLFFEEGDELYYYETDYRKRYGAQFPIGMMCDIPDDRGIYRKWLIVGVEIANQFPQYLILPCQYKYQWIEEKDNLRIKRQMWGVLRSQSSYNSGLWTDNIVTTPENVEKLILPINPITEYLYYTHPVSGNNQRMIVSALTTKPIVWSLSKIENHSPIGLVKVTLAQDLFKPDTDYVNLETGEMYADFYSSTITPSDEKLEVTTTYYCSITCNTNTITIGGSYKTLTATCYESNGNDITEDYIDLITEQSWKCYCDGIELTNTELITWRFDSDNPNKMKIKFGSDRSYLTKILTVQCVVNDNITGEIQLEISA